MGLPEDPLAQCSAAMGPGTAEHSATSSSPVEDAHASLK